MNNIADLKGVGPKSLEILNKLNIYTIEDLVTYYPYRYDVIKQTSLYDEHSIVVGIIQSVPVLNYFGKLNRLSFKSIIQNKLINVVIFNRGYLKNNLKVGSSITLFGKYDVNKNTFNCNNIKLIDIKDNVYIEPVYHLIKSINNKSMKKYIKSSLDGLEIKDYIPYEYVKKYSFIPKIDALKNIHFPSNKNILKDSILRCKYEELFIFMLKINFLKRRNNEYLKGYKKNIDKIKVDEFINNLDFKLTADQIKVLEDIENDLNNEKRMNRLIEGDVGSGKTIIAMISMFILYLNDFQSSLMAPTEILAKQHYENAKELFKNYEINIALLVGSMNKKEKDEVKKDIKNGKIDIIIGTHSLIQTNVEFKNLGLVITDEQHRFGVNQRNNFRNKGNLPDVLYMSATPIPRTYALTIYGDMDISIIKEMPKGRKKIETFVKNTNEIKDVLISIKKELDQNHQIYVVSPLIENADDDRADIDKLYSKFKLAFKNYNIDILHGKMPSKEKEKIMNKFLNKEIDILISTTVIEVGVDVKNATMMVIFDAYNFGLATLHQLRGRVGRNNYQSYCYLITNKETQRLKIMETTNDGFKLAEEDFKLRGYGDLFGVKQSGDMTFKIADLTKDFNMLLQAKADSEEILNSIENYNDLKKILKNSLNMD